MNRASPVEQLAVALQNSDAAELDGLWLELAKSGDLVSTARGTLIPSRSRMRALADVGFTYWPEWAELGFVPFMVKPASFSASRTKSLSAVLRALIEIGEDDILPHWVTPRAVISLYLPDAMDLRPFGRRVDIHDAAWIHSRCLDCIRQFVRLDSRLRLASLASGEQAPEAFPISSRYESSVAAVSGFFGSVAANDLLAAIPKQHSAAPTMLFADPKPANFIVRRSQRGKPRLDGTRAIQVDLDMLHFSSPVALQLVLVLFSHPVVFEIEGDFPSRFLHQYNLLCGYGNEFGVSHDEIEAILWYHLLRNFAGALSADDREKAGSMARLLAIAGRLLSAVRVDPGFIRTIERWVAADDGSLDSNRS
ncbi:hypothetical protein [Bradyrhizobium japonicum]|uniref:hypothetical protein n=1 Tax=Bradyrhizobium japonicum TaxID=375 RepID=UPI00200C0E5F|nr:hypothetical protein [Bradyrhizobium japonicum]UQE03638.1 hypothetical protein JEY30_47790 [Bradyrhizobium japonicum]